MKHLLKLLTLAAALMAVCPDGRAQVLATNTTTGNVTLSNTVWRVAFTAVTDGNVPPLTTFYNFGAGGIEYTTGGNTNASHYLAPGAQITFGPVTKIAAAIYWRCASNVNSTVRSVRDFGAAWGSR
jgi:hypothetical protein